MKHYLTESKVICHLSCFALCLTHPLHHVGFNLLVSYHARTKILNQVVGKTCRIVLKVGKTYKTLAEVAMTDINMRKVGRRRRYMEVGKTAIFDNDGGMTDNFTLHVGMADRKKVPWPMSAALGGPCNGHQLGKG